MSYISFMRSPIELMAPAAYAVVTLSIRRKTMHKLISALFATALFCAGGTALAANQNSGSGQVDRSGARNGTGVVTGDQGVVTPSDTNTGVGSTGLDQETRAGQNTQEGINTGTRQIPSDKRRSQ
jgi:hypothetical protein